MFINKAALILLAGCAATVTAQPVFHASSNFDTSYTLVPGTSDYNLVVLLASGQQSGTVHFDMANSTDRVLNLSIQSNGETNQVIELAIEGIGAIAGKMGALIEIDNDAAVELLVQTIHIDGDLGQAGATVAAY